MIVKEFRFLGIADPFDLRWEWWSRIYEYEWILRALPSTGRIHNTAAGGDLPLAVRFANELISRGYDVVNSDVTHQGKMPNYQHYDIMTRWEGEPFDVLLNVSTLEHLPADNQRIAFRHMLAQVKSGGHVFITFDYPTADLDAIQQFCGREIEDRPDQLTCRNGPVKDTRWGFLSVGVLLIQV
jgi:hypothetical protein